MSIWKAWRSTFPCSTTDSWCLLCCNQPCTWTWLYRPFCTTASDWLVLHYSVLMEVRSLELKDQRHFLSRCHDNRFSQVRHLVYRVGEPTTGPVHQWKPTLLGFQKVHSSNSKRKKTPMISPSKHPPGPIFGNWPQIQNIPKRSMDISQVGFYTVVWALNCRHQHELSSHTPPPPSLIPPALPLPLGHPSSPLAPPAPQSPIPNLLPYERPLKNHPGAHFRNFTVSSHSVALTTSGSRLFPFPGGRAPTDISPTVEAEPFPAAVHSCRVVARAVEDAVAIGNDRGPAARECCREKVRPSGREWRWFVKDGVLVLVAQATRVERWPVYLRQLQNPGASGRKGQCSGNFDAVTFIHVLWQPWSSESCSTNF